MEKNGGFWQDKVANGGPVVVASAAVTRQSSNLVGRVFEARNIEMYNPTIPGTVAPSDATTEPNLLTPATPLPGDGPDQDKLMYGIEM